MRPIRVVIATFDSAQILDVTGPLEVFSSASRHVQGAEYETEVVTVRGGPVRASCGLEFASTAIASVAGPVDTLMIAGGSGVGTAVLDHNLLQHVHRLALDARRVTSVCTGAFVLAAAGLLEGRRATTHWAECDDLAITYPNVTVDTDAIYVQDGNVWTSAGITAGIDLALALVTEDHGGPAATRISRQLVVYLQAIRRTGPVLVDPRRADRGQPPRTRPAFLVARPPHRRPLSASTRPTRQPLRTPIHPTLQGAGGDHRRGPRRDGPHGVRLPTPRDHEQLHRTSRPRLRIRNPRNDEPHLPPTPRHHTRRASSPLPGPSRAPRRAGRALTAVSGGVGRGPRRSRRSYRGRKGRVPVMAAGVRPVCYRWPSGPRAASQPVAYGMGCIPGCTRPDS